MHWASASAVVFPALLALCAGQQQQPISEVGHSGSSATSQHAGEADAPSYRDKLLQLLESLVSIPSVSGEENEVGQFLVDYLEQEQYHVAIQFIAPPKDNPDVPDRFNVLAWRGERKPNYKALVTSHIDTVPPHIPWDIEGGEIGKHTIIKGRGTTDAKGSVATQILAVNELLSTNKNVNPEDIILLFVVGEETTGDGMKTFSASLEHMNPPLSFDSAIFGEPTENKLACGHKGALFCTVVAKGKDAHSGYPEMGKSANELMIRAMNKIYDTDLGYSPLFGNTTFNAGRFDGGVASNVIPARAFVDLAARVASGSEKEGHKEVQKKILDILTEVDDEAFTFECTHGYGPYESNCDVEGFDQIVVNYGTDIPNLDADYVRYLYGPGSILVAHGDHEYITVGDLEQAVEDYQKLILHALNQ
ncbi:M20_dimer domain-containing protein [Trichoderma simmonsii]|uniref:M20_dimer domain-containing protein n=1 Tax=Trichoderma simmonsii TaxID=1491479 RepID=A0A8G0PH00_9HYPO|nr:M20_dimer domain-containing protein [Trichoderma simmonsii]